MSSASPFRRSPASPTPGAQWRNLVARPVRATGFWLAVAIPFLLLGLVVTGAIFDQVELFASLVAANVLALRVGHTYNRE